MGLLEKLFGPNVEKLAQKGDVDGLIRIVESGPSVEDRLAALHALADRPESAAVQVLVNTLKSDENAVSQAAEKALRALGPEAAPFLIEALATDSGDTALSILIDLETEGVEPLQQALHSTDENARRRALDGIRELDRRLDNPEIREVRFRAHLAALGDGAADCRVLAASDLAELADPRAGRALAAQLKDGEEQVRAACRSALRVIGGAAAPFLADTLADRNPNARSIAAELLGEVCRDGSDTETLTLAFTALLDHVNDAVEEVRASTVRSLKTLPVAAILETHLENLGDPERSDHDELLEVVLGVLEHADVPPNLRAGAVTRIQTLGLSNDDHQ